MLGWHQYGFSIVPISTPTANVVRTLMGITVNTHWFFTALEFWFFPVHRRYWGLAPVVRIWTWSFSNGRKIPKIGIVVCRFQLWWVRQQILPSLYGWMWQVKGSSRLLGEQPWIVFPFSPTMNSFTCWPCLLHPKLLACFIESFSLFGVWVVILEDLFCSTIYTSLTGHSLHIQLVTFGHWQQQFLTHDGDLELKRD